MLGTESRGPRSCLDVGPDPSALPGFPGRSGGGRLVPRRTGDVALVERSAMTRPSASSHLQRSGSKGIWSRSMANATRLARWPRAQATTPGRFPRASSPAAYRAKSGMSLAEGLAELEDGLPELDLALPGDPGPRPAAPGRLIEPWDQPGQAVDLRRAGEPPGSPTAAPYADALTTATRGSVVRIAAGVRGGG